MDFRQVSAYLDGALVFGIKPSLIRINKILELMGQPHRDTDHIHIVGTNGKTSTSLMLAHMLWKSGFRTACHISPHIKSYNERIWIDGGNIPEEKFAGAFNRMYPFVEEVNRLDLGGPITQFEMLSALAFMIASQEEVQVMVLEAGMGGRWDATNAAHALVCGLTGVSLEHTEILGDTVEDIAREKVEVIKEGSRAATISSDPAVIEIFKEKAVNAGAGYYLYGRDFSIGDQVSRGISGREVDIRGIYGDYPGIKLPLLGDYQMLNLSLAVCLAELFMDTRGLRPRPGRLRDSLSDMLIAGRFQVLGERPLVIADASHNLQGMENFCRTLEEYFHDRKKTVIFAVLSDKDYRGMIGEVLKVSDRLILTSSGDDRSLGLERLMQETQSAAQAEGGNARSPDRIYTMDTVENSLKFALKISGSNDIIGITGSITNLGHLDL